MKVPGQETNDSPSASESDTPDKSNEKIRVGVSVADQANVYWAAWLGAIEDYAEEHDLELLVHDATGSAEKQVAAIENWVHMGVDAMIISPLDPTACSVVCNQAIEKGIKVLCNNYELENYDFWMYIPQYDIGYLQGKTTAEWIKAHYGDEKIQVVGTNYDVLPSVVDRTKGYMEALAEFAPNAEFVRTATSTDATTGLEAAENFLQAYPDLKVFIGHNDGSCLGALEAFIAAGKTDPDKYLLAGVDGMQEALELIDSGDSIFQITVDQAPIPMGRTLIETAEKLVNGETVEKVLAYETTAITKENVKDFLS